MELAFVGFWIRVLEVRGYHYAVRPPGLRKKIFDRRFTQAGWDSCGFFVRPNAWLRREKIAGFVTPWFTTAA
jgi:hypothetical protein